jgi:hypothetical protein
MHFILNIISDNTHRDNGIHIERTSMHCQDIAFTMVLATAENQELECFKWISLPCSKDAQLFDLNQATFWQRKNT